MKKGDLRVAFFMAGLEYSPPNNKAQMWERGVGGGKRRLAQHRARA